MAEDTTPGRSWGWLRNFLLGDRDVTLRDQIEDAIDEHEGDNDAPAKGDLSPEVRDMVRKVLHLGELRVDDVAVQRGDIIAVPETLGFDDLVKASVTSGSYTHLTLRDSSGGSIQIQVSATLPHVRHLVIRGILQGLQRGLRLDERTATTLGLRIQKV